jgi:hypothetical protein
MEDTALPVKTAADDVGVAAATADVCNLTAPHDNSD